MRDDIIPIIFMGGTGGNFLSAFLSDARDNKKIKYELSKHGNAHRVVKDPIPTPPSTVVTESSLIIDKLLNTPANDKVSFVAVHINNVTLATLYFSKIIKTFIEEQNKLEVAISFYLKLVADELSCRSDDTARRILFMNEFPELINKGSDSTQVLDIGWEEIVRGSEVALVKRLSDFTSIPEANFNVQNLLTWREITLAGIKSFG